MNAQAASQRGLFGTCFAIAMVDGFDTLVVSFIAPHFAREWGLEGPAVGEIFASGLIGAMLGGLISGPLADRFGRKSTLIGCIALFAALTLACAAAPDPNTLMALRFVAGLGLGGAIPTITALTAEHVAPERRTASVTRMFVGFPLGAVGGGLICSVMVEELGWRSAFWMGGILAVLLIPAALWGVRETLARQGAAHTPIAKVFAEGRAAAAFCLCVAAFAILLVSYFLISWTPTILSRAGMPDSLAILGGAILNLGGVAGALIVTVYIARRGAFRTAAAALAFGAVLTIFFGHGVDQFLLAAPLVFAAGMGVIGGQLNLPALASALYPPAVRATGVGVTLAAGRAGSIIGPYAGGWLVDAQIGVETMFLLVAAPAALSAILLWLMPRLSRAAEG